MSLTNFGEAQTMVTFESYEQLRDYSDVTAVVRIASIAVTEPYVDPYAIPGELEIVATVESVLGGRFTDVTAADSLRISLPMHATDEVVSSVKERLDALEGSRYLLFMQALLEDSTDQPTRSEPLMFRPVLYGAPPAILAEWPDDGRLTDLVPHDYIAREAIERGERLTGTSVPPIEEWTPNFPDNPPIGLTIDEAIESFKGEPGRPTVDPPAGWAELERRLAPA